MADELERFQQQPTAHFLDRSVDDVRAEADAAGASVRAVRRGDSLTMDFRPSRLTVVVEDDRIVEVLGFQ
jgi:hypothetical protein